MLDINFIRENISFLKNVIKKRGIQADIDFLLAMDNERRSMLTELENLRSERKKISKEIGDLKKSGKDAAELMQKAEAIGTELVRTEELYSNIEKKFNEQMLTFPNIPHKSVPEGPDDSANRIERYWGEKPNFNFQVKPHEQIATDLGIIDFERAAKITGSRFAVYIGIGALLERALINFMLDIQTRENGYIEILPPFIINSKSLISTGQLPKFAEDLFRVDYRDYYLVPTAEVPLTNHFADEILNEDDLPVKLTAYTPCFRSEAGSYGQDVKGLIRQHQFNKVEIVKFAHPDNSWDELESLTINAEKVLQKLRLHYRVVTLSTGDLGFSASKTYDLEVWLPSQERYREISSCSNFTDFQARRAGIRFKDKKTGKNRLVHTLNGSALAVGRTTVAILENYQQADGTVLIPEALRPYMNGLEYIGVK